MESQNKNFFQSALGVAVTAAVLFVVVYAVSSGWKAGQK